jgi:hypothetical protein
MPEGMKFSQRQWFSQKNNFAWELIVLLSGLQTPKTNFTAAA